MSLAVLESQIAEKVKGNPEIGRALRATEMTPRTVVVVVPPPYTVILTNWVISVDLGAGVLVCYAGTINNTIISKFDDAGKVFDDRGLPIFFFEYKGEV